jgi:hypothetical protein
VVKDRAHDWGFGETLPVAISNYTWLWQPARGDDYDPTEPFDVNATDDVDNLFVNELSDSGKGAAGGNKGILILFKGFNYNETYEFSADMDSNSLAGLSGGAILGGSNWDVGGVSGAEMIGSTITLLFDDGTTASGTLASDGSQAGAVAYIRATDDMTDAPELTVEGTTEEEDAVVTYCQNLTIAVSAATNQTVQVTMIRAFNPVVSEFELANMTITAQELVAARLAVQFPYFPANNARELQHVVITVGNDTAVDITSSFLLTGVNDTLAFSAVVVDADGLPLSDVSEPVYLVYGNCTGAPATAPVVGGTTKAPTTTPVVGGGNVTVPATKAPKGGTQTTMPGQAGTKAPTAVAPAAPVAAPTTTTTNTTNTTTTKMPSATASAPVKAPVKAPVASPSSGCHNNLPLPLLLVLTIPTMMASFFG